MPSEGSHTQLPLLFGGPSIRAYAYGDRPMGFIHSIHEAGIHSSGDTLLDVLSRAYDRLLREYRCEYVFKNELAKRRFLGRHSPRTAAFLQELYVGGHRLDAALFNGIATAFEIKSDYDSRERVADQFSAYLAAFESVYLVCTERGVARFGGEVPIEVGILVLSSDGRFSERRRPKIDRGRLDSRMMFNVLRKPEYLSAIRLLYGEVPSLPNGIIRTECMKMFTRFPGADVAPIWSNLLRMRAQAMTRSEFWASVPHVLSAGVLASGLPKSQYTDLFRKLMEPAVQ